MRQSVTFRKPSASRTEIGDVTKSWEDVTVLVDCMYSPSREFVQGGLPVEQHDVTYLIPRSGRLREIDGRWRAVDPLIGAVDVIAAEPIPSGLIAMTRVRGRRSTGSA